MTTKYTHILSLILTLFLLVFFGYTLLGALDVNVSRLTDFVELGVTIKWINLGIQLFFLSMVFYALYSLLFGDTIHLIGLVGYLIFVFTMRSTLDNFSTITQLFECSLNYQDHCVSISRQFQTFDFNALDVNIVLVIVSLVLILASIMINLVRYSRRNWEDV